MAKASAHDYHGDLRDAHTAAAESHLRMAEEHLSLCKALDTMPAVTRETATHDSEFGGRGFHAAEVLGDLSKIVPDGVKQIIPDGFQLIPRHGAPTPVDTSGVPAELQDLVKVD